MYTHTHTRVCVEKYMHKHAHLPVDICLSSFSDAVTEHTRHFNL